MIRNIDEFLKSLDIVEVIGRYISLRRAGQNYTAPCPFHNETKPSFSVSANKQMFYCFGCHAGGNAIKFIQEYENLSFVDALKFLSERYNIPLDMDIVKKEQEENRKEESIRNQYHQAFEFVFALLHQYLTGNAPQAVAARKYLIESRGLPEEVIHQFKLGLIPSDNNYVSRRLKENFKDLRIFLNIGIIGNHPTHGYYDKLVNRITFPIHDGFGKGIALGARLMEGEGPKYINSPENPVFYKSRTFYGLHLAKPQMNKEKSLFLTEGYLDVIRMHSCGFLNTVATLGTALTEEHCKVLKRRVQKVHLMYDSDEPGVKAALKATALLLSHQIDYDIIYLEKNEDPDSFLRRHPRSDLDKCVENSLNIIEFTLHACMQRSGTLSSTDKQAIMKDLLPIFACIKSPALLEDYLSQLSSILNIGQSSLKLELNRFLKLEKKANRNKSAPTESVEMASEDDAVREKTSEDGGPSVIGSEESILRLLIHYLLLSPGLAAPLKKVMDFSYLEKNRVSLVLKKLSEIPDLISLQDPAGQIDLLPLESREKELVMQILFKEQTLSSKSEQELKRGFLKQLKKLLQLILKNRQKDLKIQLKTCTDPEKKGLLFNEIVQLGNQTRDIDSTLKECLNKP